MIQDGGNVRKGVSPVFFKASARPGTLHNAGRFFVV